MNFEKFHRDIQVEDLYYFLRKVMEKSGWKLRLGDGMLNAYSAIHPLTRSETEYLKIRLIYPEKFWKIANSYYCMNKAWISVKNTEKFMDIVARLYSSYGSEKLLIPNGMIRMLQDKEKFSEYGYAFVLGLIGCYEGKKEVEQ